MISRSQEPMNLGKAAANGFVYCFVEILAEMETIGDLLRLGCLERCAFGIQAATIARHCHDFGMLFEPLCEALGGICPAGGRPHGADPD